MALYNGPALIWVRGKGRQGVQINNSILDYTLLCHDTRGPRSMLTNRYLFIRRAALLRVQ